VVKERRRRGKREGKVTLNGFEKQLEM